MDSPAFPPRWNAGIFHFRELGDPFLELLGYLPKEGQRDRFAG